MTRDEQILSLGWLVRWHALRAARLFRGHFDDLEAAAWVGAIQAVDKFNPDRGIQLKTFADARILGAIRDFQRAVDPLTRDHRRLVKEGRLPEPCEFPIGSQPRWLFRVASNASQTIAAIDLQNLIERAQLTRRQRQVLQAYFFEDRTLQEIARTFGFNEGRASQIKTDALKKLRAAA